MISRFVWLLDTNVVSEMMRPSPEPRIVAFLDSIADEGVGLAAVTVWEILDGFGRPNPDRHRDNLIERFQDLLDELFEDRIVDRTVGRRPSVRPNYGRQAPSRRAARRPFA